MKTFSRPLFPVVCQQWPLIVPRHHLCHSSKILRKTGPFPVKAAKYLSSISNAGSSSESLASSYEKIRDFIRYHSTVFMGAEKLESVKATIGELQNVIMADKETLLKALAEKNELAFKLSECESGIDHIKKFRRVPDGKQLDGDEYLKSVGGLNVEQHKLQQALAQAYLQVEALTNNIQRNQITLDKQLALRYQEELLVLERSRTFSAIATLASFITTLLLIISRTMQTHSYEQAIARAEEESIKQKQLLDLETENGLKRDEVLAQVSTHLQDLKSVADKQEDLMKALMAQQELIRLLSIANSKPAEIVGSESNNTNAAGNSSSPTVDESQNWHQKAYVLTAATVGLMMCLMIFRPN